MKIEHIQEFEETEGILFYQGRIASVNQLRTQDWMDINFSTSWKLVSLYLLF